ncbi:MAG: 4-hydroxy-3-methylbut-2-enyl diphosphate reductase [Nitrospiraceae bacterium]|nr:4-hydroxy-3-methylbut-2-enyl diphosphate reductase [Nitrospiraceae bacterium]
MKVILVKPRGFCAGVVRAIKVVERALEAHTTPVYVLHEIVHNRYVVEDLQTRGAHFVEDLDEVPAGAVTIFSAHGVSNALVEHAEERNLKVIDATCPLVTKVHVLAQHYSRKGIEVIIIGHRGHPEVEGTRGCIDGPVHVLSDITDLESIQVIDPNRLAYVTQTTLSIEDTREIISVMKRHFPNIKGSDSTDICYATQNRQNAVRRVAKEVDVLLVVGARNSSNSNRLREVGEQNGLDAYLIEDADGIDPSWFTTSSRIGITAGASAPEILVQGVLKKLVKYGVKKVEEMEGEHETMHFSLPRSEFL